MRIALAGIAVECCTFSPLATRLEDFVIQRGDDLLTLYPFLANYPDITFVPLIRAKATPGGKVEWTTYAALTDELLDGLRTEGPWDGVYLELHGAMFVEGLHDAEQHLLRAVRTVVGAECCISASFDLHGNLSAEAALLLDVLTAYRTAPHEDIDETRARAVQLLIECAASKLRPVIAHVSIPLLLGGEQAMTTSEPARSLYAMLPTMIAEYELLDASSFVGYAWADEPRVGVSIVALGLDKTSTREAAYKLAQAWWQQRDQFRFGMPTGSVDEAIQLAWDAAQQVRPVFLSDAGDNITGGGVGDVPFVLERLLAANVHKTLYAAILDAAAVQACQRAGVGASLRLSLGGKLDTTHGSPLEVSAKVCALADGENPQAVVSIAGIDVVLTTRRTPFTTLEAFTRLGVDPATYSMVVVKLGYLFPEVRAVATQSVLAFSPGAINPDLLSIPYRHLGRAMYPLQPHLIWEPIVIIGGPDDDSTR